MKWVKFRRYNPWISDPMPSALEHITLRARSRAVCWFWYSLTTFMITLIVQLRHWSLSLSLRNGIMTPLLLGMTMAVARFCFGGGIGFWHGLMSMKDRSRLVVDYCSGRIYNTRRESSHSTKTGDCYRGSWSSFQAYRYEDGTMEERRSFLEPEGSDSHTWKTNRRTKRIAC